MSRGGSRYGAGRPAQKLKVERTLQIDARRWNREGLLKPGHIRGGGWQWTDGETREVLGSIGYRVDDDRIELDYSVGGTPTHQVVHIERTACNYGGARPWFICPIRGERVAVLYMRAGRFACRHCQKLAYGSQSDDVFGRLWRKQWKLEAKLDKNWSRPKGMHTATAERLRDGIFDCEERRDVALEPYLALLKRLDSR